MAPSTVAVEMLSPKEKNRLRKPVVEKMRRDRINSSIEQLKLLLEQEFARHQPNSKLEKADILEMAVSYLKHSKAFAAAAGPKSLHQDYSEGYSWCLQEAVQFLTLHAASDTQMKLLYHFQRPPAPAAPAKDPRRPGLRPNRRAPPLRPLPPSLLRVNPPAASGGPGDPAGRRTGAWSGPWLLSE